MDPARDFVVTRTEFLEGMQEQVDNIRDVMNVVNALKNALNTQAEVMGCHRYILERFVPEPLLERAASEYAKLRAEAIEQERLAGHGISAAHSGN